MVLDRAENFYTAKDLHPCQTVPTGPVWLGRYSACFLVVSYCVKFKYKYTGSNTHVIFQSINI